MNERSCPQCGALNPSAGRFCFACGLELVGSRKRARTPPSSSLAPPAKSKSILSSRVQFWLLTAVGALFVLLLTGGIVWFIIGLNPDLTQIASIKLNKIEQPTYGDSVTDRELQKLLPVAENFSNPRTREALPGVVSPDLLISSPSKYNNHTVVVQGSLSRLGTASNLLENDWPRAYILGIWAEGKEILVIYRGYVEHLEPGDSIQVEGVFVEDGKGIHANKVTRLEMDSQSQEQERLWLTRASIGVFLWLVFCTSMFLWRGFRKNWYEQHRALTLLCLFLIAGTVAGCKMDINTMIDPDGSGLVTASLTRAKEDIDFIRKMPGMSGYLDAWAFNLRNDGMRVEDLVEGENETFFLQRTFGSLNELIENQLLSESGTWVHVLKYPEGNEQVFRFTALIDATILYSGLDELPSTAAEQIRQELDQAELSYSVVLPGKIVYHNAPIGQSQRLTWRLRVNDGNEIVAESRLPIQVSTGSLSDPKTKIKQGLLLVFTASSLLLIIGLVGYRLPEVGNA